MGHPARLNRFHFFDMAIKVVGIGSVGAMCGVGLFMAADNDPLFLQVKEARASVPEPYAGRSAYPNHGQRDYRAFIAAIREGRIEAKLEES